MEPEWDYCGRGSSWSQLLTELDYRRPSSWIGSRGDQTTADKHSGHSSSGSHTSENGGFSWSRVPWGLDCCEPGFRPCDFLLWQGRFFCRKVQSSWSWLWEPDYRRQLNWSGLSELDYRGHFLWEPDILRHVSGHEFWEQSRGSISYGSWGHCGCWSRFTKEPVCCGPTWGPPVGTDSSGQDQTQSAHKVAATDGADTTDRGSSVNQTHGTAEASSTADTVWVVSMAMHTTGDTGSQLSTQLTACCSHLYSSLLPRTVALERVPTEPWKCYQFSLQCQLMTEIRWCLLFPYRLWQVCIIHPAWRCPLLAWMWNTDHQTWQIRWEPATASTGRLFDPTTTVRSIGPADIISRTAICAAAHSYCWCTGPAGPGCCHHGVSHVEDDE